jgi:DNA-binding response OmpR family regulator
MNSGHRILIVEGDESVCQMLKSGFAIHGLTASFARDGATAIAMIQEEPAAYAAVLMDVVPKRNVMAAPTIRQIAPTLPIAFMTAADESILSKEATAFGAELLLKPFHSVRDLADTIKAMIGEKCEG